MTGNSGAGSIALTPHMQHETLPSPLDLVKEFVSKDTITVEDSRNFKDVVLGGLCAAVDIDDFSDHMQASLDHEAIERMHKLDRTISGAPIFGPQYGLQIVDGLFNFAALKPENRQQAVDVWVGAHANFVALAAIDSAVKKITSGCMVATIKNELNKSLFWPSESDPRHHKTAELAKVALQRVLVTPRLLTC